MLPQEGTAIGGGVRGILGTSSLTHAIMTHGSGDARVCCRMRCVTTQSKDQSSYMITPGCVRYSNRSRSVVVAHRAAFTAHLGTCRAIAWPVGRRVLPKRTACGLAPEPRWAPTCPLDVHVLESYVATCRTQPYYTVLPCRQAAVQVRQVPAVHEVHLGAAAAPVLPHVRGGAGAAAGGRVYMMYQPLSNIRSDGTHVCTIIDVGGAAHARGCCCYAAGCNVSFVRGMS